MAEWSKAPDSSSGPLTRAWVQIPLLTKGSLNFLIFLYRLNCSSKNLMACKKTSQGIWSSGMILAVYIKLQE
ncbi:hypothetical protein SUGI_0839980 [Cryptomeria japonica]|nr:hypothetical protein SUGI_0839980 [Cryptomeria japonica]